MRLIEEVVLTRYKTHKRGKTQKGTGTKERQDSSFLINFNNEKNLK